jgi:outer membrane receptor for ferrienterochelin and colicins
MRTNSLRAGISADTGIGLLSLSTYRNGLHAAVGTRLLNGLANWADQSVYVVQASDLVKLGSDHALRFGIEYRNNAATAPGFLQGTIGYEVFAASLMWDWDIASNLSLTSAVRLDHLQLRYSGTPAAGSGLTLADYNNARLTVPSFNAGLVFTATPEDTFRLMAARGVQLPSLLDFGLQIPFGAAGPVIATGNPRMHPSTVDSVELDYDRSLPVIDSSLRVALFAQRNRDMIAGSFSVPPIIGPTGLPVQMAGNVGSSDAAGIELGIKGHSSTGFRWNLSYAFVATSDDTVLNRGPFISSPIDYARSVPRSVVAAGIGYTYDRLELDLLGRWQSSYRDFQGTGNGVLLQPVEVRNYLTLNARAGYRLTDNFTVSLTAQQFNTSRLLQTAGPPVERRVIAGVTARF